jgi:mRNA interferase MazF
MPGYDVWDLMKVPFPYTNRPVQQRRPALVVAIPATPAAPQLVWVLMVTSAANRAWAGDVAVASSGNMPSPFTLPLTKHPPDSGATAKMIEKVADLWVI